MLYRRSKTANPLPAKRKPKSIAPSDSIGSLRRDPIESEGAIDFEPVASETETEIYRALGLDWIPPELRENQGEIEAAENGSLPKLVNLNDIRGDLHMHTRESDGRATLEE